MSSVVVQERVVSFFRMIPACPSPQRADRLVGDLLPGRAFRFCDPVTTASAFGWYVFPPFAFALQFDGLRVTWTHDAAGQWNPLDAAQFPDFSAYFDRHAPGDLRGCSPPFLTAYPEPGHVQVWSGFVARTRPGWSLLVRPVPNFPRHAHYEVFEGTVETDNWFGPLFTHLRLKKTDAPIEFRAGLPLFHVQPIERRLYASPMLDDIDVTDMPQWSGAEWDGFRDAVVMPGESAATRSGRQTDGPRRRRRHQS